MIVSRQLDDNLTWSFFERVERKILRFGARPTLEGFRRAQFHVCKDFVAYLLSPLSLGPSLMLEDHHQATVVYP